VLLVLWKPPEHCARYVWRGNDMSCANQGGQLASVKTEREKQAAIAALQAASLKCGLCILNAWTSGLQIGYNSNLYWGDGLLFVRENVSIGLTKAPDTSSGPVEGGKCIRLDKRGLLSHSSCEGFSYPLCEFSAAKSTEFPPTKSSSDCFPGCLESMRGDGVW
jgi:hypothetical protein